MNTTAPLQAPPGPLMLDLRGPDLEADEREMLLHPLAGGVLLFARNYQDPATLAALTAQLHALREPPLLIAVDHEGGRVQRFHQGFTRLPPARRFGELYERDETRALELAGDAGWLLAAELLSVGVDLSFTPVLDLDAGVSSFLGDRTYHRSPRVVAHLAQRLMKGMRRAGMMPVGKHFPGHGCVQEDSHHAAPVDKRSYADLARNDLAPFVQLIDAGLAAVMPAHVVYPRVDARPAGFSPVWLQQILREKLNFQGMIFSDDLSMAGAAVAGDYPQRARVALAAGCDLALVCNNQPQAVRLLDNLETQADPASQRRMASMRGKISRWSYRKLLDDKRRKNIAAKLAETGEA